MPRMRTLAWTWILVAAAACGQVKNETPDASTDAAATDAVTTDATDLDAASTDAATDATPLDAFACIPDRFQSCQGNSAVTCNATGTGDVTTDCGAPGCNATAGRCNTCVPSSTTCAGSTVATCGADGLPGGTETCALSCTATPTAHCTYLQPVYLPNICDAPATVASFVATTDSIDTAVDLNCNGGIVAQAGAAPICVLRYGTITVPAGVTLTFIGGRAVALVTDGLLDVRGTIDASARGTTSGPGGGVRALTALANATNGAGGAGGFTAGAAGGNTSTPGGGHAGGTIFDPLTTAALMGGQRAAQPSLTLGIVGGGGGGGLTLISCRGTTRVSGVVDVGGGGGNGGQDQIGGSQFSPVGAGGGGAGGYAVLQGLAVTATGGFFANGGGGGGGAINDATGNPGGDGLRSATTRAPGGLSLGGTSATGGSGSIGSSAPGIGNGASSPGGGGGAGGFFQTYTPVGVNATITPSSVSPPFASNRNTPTR